MAKVEFFNVSYEEKGKVLLNDVSVEIEKGDLFMIRTENPQEGLAFLKLCCEFSLPQHGEVEVLSEDEVTLGTNIIPLIQDLTVKEVLSLPLLARGYTKPLIESRVKDITKYFSIHDVIDEQVKELTKIQKALLGICKAVIGEPSMVVLDQFSRYLDHNVAVLVMAYLHEISVDHEVTVVMVENDQKLHPFASKILHLENGQVKDLVGEGVDLQKLMPFLKI